MASTSSVTPDAGPARWGAVSVALSLLAWTATASTECASVICAKSPESQNVWQASGTHLSLSDCQKDLHRLRKHYLGDGGQWVVSHGAAYYERGEAVYQRVVCLPDTVDPRGPNRK
jgi:hypothetical protein